MSQNKNKPRIEWQYTCRCSCDEYKDAIEFNIQPRDNNSPLLRFKCPKCGNEYLLSFVLTVGINDESERTWDSQNKG